MQFPNALWAGDLLSSLVFSDGQAPVRTTRQGLAGPQTLASIDQGAPLRVLSLGDSITLGYNDPTENSYRRDLECLLWTGGNPVSMIGSVESGDWDDNKVDAWVYHTIDEIWEKAEPELTRGSKGGSEQKPPNVILLHAGTVNLVLNKNVTTAPERLGALIDFITAHNPDALLVVSQLIPYHNETVNSMVNTYNAQIPGVVAARARERKRLVLASMEGVTVDLLPDGVHPAGLGSSVMARRFYEAIVEADRRGLVIPAAGPFDDRGASSVLPSGRCSDAMAGEIE
ncbi:SGNH hydrolase-type esterase domain-containing protein [Biscogniauxia marginata]|nr:SGNH hydrolase-type esterase domain-containing protein [Biscogniauxia marginata]